MEQKHSVSPIRRIINAFGYSMAGLLETFKKEAAFRQEILLSIILIPLALWLHVSHMEKALMIGSIFLVWIAEIINSAIEAVVDWLSTEVNLARHPLAKHAKDAGSAAVLIALINAVVIWALILIK